MATNRPARLGNPDLRQQKHIPVPSIEEIEKQLIYCYDQEALTVLWKSLPSNLSRVEMKRSEKTAIAIKY
ncbi:hypothetical protein [Nostoc sp.]|uniref:hypothetical protein n=1 Tax=Nostoc sp. TaxID=1180 RepID=UPI002FF4A81A